MKNDIKGYKSVDILSHTKNKCGIMNKTTLFSKVTSCNFSKTLPKHLTATSITLFDEHLK